MTSFKRKHCNGDCPRNYILMIWSCVFVCFSEIQGVWASSACGGDRWTASGEEAGGGYGGDVSQESSGNEGTSSSTLSKRFEIWNSISKTTKSHEDGKNTEWKKKKKGFVVLVWFLWNHSVQCEFLTTVDPTGYLKRCRSVTRPSGTSWGRGICDRAVLWGEVTDRERGCDPSLSIRVTSLIGSGQTSASSVGANEAL